MTKQTQTKKASARQKLRVGKSFLSQGPTVAEQVAAMKAKASVARNDAKQCPKCGVIADQHMWGTFDECKWGKASAPETRTEHDCPECGEHFSTCICPTEAQHSPLPWETGNNDKWVYVEGMQNPIAMLENPEDAKLIVASVNHADALAEALRDLAAEVKLGKLNVRKDFSLMVAHASATKALAAWEGAQS